MDAAPKIVVPILLEKMKAENAQDIPVVVGGIVPKKEEKLIKEMGVREVFHPYSPLETVVEKIKGIAVGRV
jgi:methylmalonyl-CoA mutase C-terminal domain/subunit